MRLIDAEAFYKAVEKEKKMLLKNGKTSDSSILVGGLQMVLEWINEQPTTEAKPVVHAHWIVTSNGENKWVNKCSACGGFLKRGQKQTNFCPNCGAEMPGGSLKNNAQKVSVDGVKIPVISMEDVPKLMEEMEK